ncbi:hypothetical protein SJ620_27050, partial [Citrobacter freundii]
TGDTKRSPEIVEGTQRLGQRRGHRLSPPAPSVTPPTGGAGSSNSEPRSQGWRLAWCRAAVRPVLPGSAGGGAAGGPLDAANRAGAAL